MTTLPQIADRYDAVVIGARVAGSSVAMLLARAGLRVLMVDRMAPGKDTMSTHALMRAGVMQLHRWGVLDRIVAAGTPAIQRTSFHYGENAIEVAIKERDGVGALYAPRRYILDKILAEAAGEAGAEVVFNTHARQLIRKDDGRVCGVILADTNGVERRVLADIVVGADGANSSLARWLQPEVFQVGSSTGAVLYGYWSGFDRHDTHWYYGRTAAAGLIPTNDGEACVFVGMRPERFKSCRASEHAALFHFIAHEVNRDFGARLDAAKPAGRLTAFPGRAGYIRQPWGPGWALVGDASCFKDPITAHGMTDALRDAELLARAIVTGSDRAFEDYQAARDHFAVEFLELSDKVASFSWDFEELQTLHRRLSKLMNLECDFIRDELAASSSTQPHGAPVMAGFVE